MGYIYEVLDVYTSRSYFASKWYTHSGGATSTTTGHQVSRIDRFTLLLLHAKSATESIWIVVKVDCAEKGTPKRTFLSGSPAGSAAAFFLPFFSPFPVGVAVAAATAAPRLPRGACCATGAGAGAAGGAYLTGTASSSDESSSDESSEESEGELIP